MKDKGRSFLFILGISIVTLIVLVLGSIFFAKDSSLAFSGDGYIITTNSEKVYFKSGTTYKENLNKEYAFIDDNKKDVSVSKESFVHYNDNSIGFMKNGAIMDLESANKSIIPYYNITNKSTITYNNGRYYISTINGDLDFVNILGRISDNKYIVAGKDIKLKLPEVLTLVEGNYFEVTFIEDGVVRIENQEVSYQTTTQDTYIYVGDKIVINLGSMKVVYDGESEMSLSQITIDGNENIDILPDDKAVKEGENVGGELDGDNGNDIINNQDNNQNNQNNDNNTGNDKEDKKEDNSASIELVEADVTTNRIKASFKYNNLKNVSGNVVLSIIDVGTGNKVYNKVIDKNKVTDDVIIESLSPNTNYLMTISNASNNVNTQYFSQAFRTEELGIVLNKVYATSNSLTYKIDYLENSDVSSVTLGIYDENMNQVGSSLLSSRNNNEELTFNNLESNTSYTVRVDSIIMEGMNYVNVYNMDRTDITLKQVPDRSTMKMDAVSKGSSAYLGVSKIIDKDSSIVSYTYNIYSSNYNNDGNNTILYSKRVDANTEDTASSSLRLDIKDLPSEYRNFGYYRFNVDITYYDNEKTMVLKNGQISREFYMSLDEAEPEDDNPIKLSFKQDYEETTYSVIAGQIKISDKDHKLLVKGRDGLEDDTPFTLSYYSGDMSNKKQKTINVSSDNIDDNGNIVIDIRMDGLVNNSGYIFELYANQYDDEDIISNIIVDRSFSGTTKADVDKLKFSATSNNQVSDANVINFDGTIIATNPDSSDKLSYVKVNLYKGSTVEAGNKIGETITISGNEIFNKNYNFTNNIFGIIDINDLIEKSGGNLVQNYTIELFDAYYESGNLAQVENNVYKYTIPLAYLLERIISPPSIAVDPILNDVNDDNYDSKLGSDAIIGYDITASASIEELKSKVGELGVESINYYIYKINSNGNEELIKTINSNELSMQLYFDNIEGFNRGGKYVFKYDISIKDEETKYPTTPVASEIFRPYKISPTYTIYKSYTNVDKNEVVYKYKIIDVDDALHKESDNTYKFYYTIDGSEEQIKKDLDLGDGYHELVIDGLSKGNDYNINYYKEITDGDLIKEKLVSDTYEGLQKLDDYNLKYELNYSSDDNRLAIHILNNEFLDRVILYEVTIKSTGVEEYKKRFNRDSLVSCPTLRDNNCIVIDYASIERFKGKDARVSLNVYYDNGLSGIDLYNTSSDLLGVDLNYGYVFKSDNDYLSLDREGKFVKANSNSIYNYSISDNKVNFVDYFNNNISNNIDISYNESGVVFKDKGNYYPKGISFGSVTCDDDYFRFDSIILKIAPTNSIRTIAKVKIGINVNKSGITANKLREEFQKENDNSYSINVRFYKNPDDSDNYIEGKIKLTIDSSDKVKVESVVFNDLAPQTTYYYRLFAMLKQTNKTTGDTYYKEIELFDSNDTGSYSTSQYSVSTLNAKEIFPEASGAGIAFNARLQDSASTQNYVSYDHRAFNLRYTANNYEDYTLKIEFVDPNGNNYFSTNPVTRLDSNNEVLDMNNLDPTLVSRNTGIFGTLSDNFVFGNDYYNVNLIAVSNAINPDTGEHYELSLYDKKHPLVTVTSGSANKQVNVKTLSKPTISTTPQTDISPTDSSKAIITVDITIADKDKVILNSEQKSNVSEYEKSERGTYIIKLLDNDGNTVRLCKMVNDNVICNDSLETSEFSATGAKRFVFDGLDPSTLYTIVIETYIYRNNFKSNNLVDQLELISFKEYVTTPSVGNVNLGFVNGRATSNSITLTYTSYSNILDIDEIDYTITENGGSSDIGSGTLTKPIFTISNNTAYLTFSGLEELTLGSTYMVRISYKKNGEILFKNQTYSVPYVND